MAQTAQRTVITGIGLLTPLGLGHQATWENALAGKSGVRRITIFDPSGMKHQIAGELPDFDARKHVDKKNAKGLKVMGRAIQIGVAASFHAISDAGLDLTKIDPNRFGIDFGSANMSTELDELVPGSLAAVPEESKEVDMTIWGTKGMPTMPPLWMLKYLPNFAAAHVSIMMNAQGPSNSVTMSDVASSLALAEAHRVMDRGLADIMLSGGNDSKVTPLVMTRLNLFMPVAPSNENPEAVCAPFDKSQTGLVYGEGAGILVLETETHAKSRGAKVYAELVAEGDAFDVNMNGDGVARAIDAAMSAAGIKASDLDHINAQGYSHPTFDRMEAAGITKYFGSDIPPVFAAKGFFGNLGAASGSVELALSVLALQHGKLPGSRNFTQNPPEYKLPISSNVKPVTKNHALKINFSDMGQCSALIVRKWEG